MVILLMQCYRMVCGLPRLESELRQGLAALGVEEDATAPNTLLIDAPSGWAPSQLQDTHLAQTVIVSDNPCAEYRLELLERQPAALLSNVSLEELADQLKDLADCQPPILASPLTPTERLILRLSAHGRSTKQIAQHKDISDGRVKNIIGAVYQKLGLKCKAHLTLYYFGLWHVLEAQGWEPPRYTRD